MKTINSICVYCGSKTGNNPSYKEAAIQVGALLARRNISLVYGGGNVGLMKAVRRFNPEKGVRLVSFAVHWIKAEIHEFILKNWRIVKVATTKAQRKLFFNLRSAKKELEWLSQDEARAIANDLDVELKDVMEMEMRLSSTDTAFDLSQDDDEDSGTSVSYTHLTLPTTEYV